MPAIHEKYFWIKDLILHEEQSQNIDLKTKFEKCLFKYFNDFRDVNTNVNPFSYSSTKNFSKINKYINK